MNKGHCVACATPGCGRSFVVTALHPYFPKGPFYCPTCTKKGRHEGAPGIPDDDDHAVTLEELDEDGAVVAVDIPLPKKW